MHCSLVIRQKLLAINTKILVTLSICKRVKFTKCQQVKVLHLNVNVLGNDIDLCALYLKWDMDFSL